MAGPNADDEMRRVVDARIACAEEKESRGLQKRVSETFLEWDGDDVQLPGDRRFICSQAFGPLVLAAGAPGGGF